MFAIAILWRAPWDELAFLELQHLCPFRLVCASLSGRGFESIVCCGTDPTPRNCPDMFLQGRPTFRKRNGRPKDGL